MTYIIATHTNAPHNPQNATTNGGAPPKHSPSPTDNLDTDPPKNTQVQETAARGATDPQHRKRDRRKDQDHNDAALDNTQPLRTHPKHPRARAARNKRPTAKPNTPDAHNKHADANTNNSSTHTNRVGTQRNIDKDPTEHPDTGKRASETRQKRRKPHRAPHTHLLKTRQHRTPEDKPKSTSPRERPRNIPNPRQKPPPPRPKQGHMHPQNIEHQTRRNARPASTDNAQHEKPDAPHAGPNTERHHSRPPAPNLHTKPPTKHAPKTRTPRPQRERENQATARKRRQTPGHRTGNHEKALADSPPQNDVRNSWQRSRDHRRRKGTEKDQPPAHRVTGRQAHTIHHPAAPRHREHKRRKTKQRRPHRTQRRAIEQTPGTRERDHDKPPTRRANKREDSNAL
ncbi:hypothetical protein BV20DRAFT_1051019 [Pilatotrama ljubarskyi]|nr:hypothetical protein BV20DRAFT_1051019 [Pilatotrama ljubarskyi]